jgi:hypothetical protein
MVRMTMSSTRHSGTVPLLTMAMRLAPHQPLVAVTGLPSFWSPWPYARKPGMFMSAPASAGWMPSIMAAQSEMIGPWKSSSSLMTPLRTFEFWHIWVWLTELYEHMTVATPALMDSANGQE